MKVRLLKCDVQVGFTKENIHTDYCCHYGGSI